MGLFALVCAHLLICIWKASGVLALSTVQGQTQLALPSSHLHLTLSTTFHSLQVVVHEGRCEKGLQNWPSSGGIIFKQVGWHRVRRQKVNGMASPFKTSHHL